ncbi:MAG TPA: transcriptional regulator MntR, partial [Gammaproteobacteria bacterium]|nr:transcriptional regulator MntR [Gammaproteobacteria bacterium]
MTDGKYAPENEAPTTKGAVSAYMTAATQAAHFRQVRRAHETETIEDYVELIADLIDESGEARSVEICRRLGVSSATVNKMIARLQQLDLVTAQPYRSIFLTDEGRAVAEKSRKRH